MRISEILQKKRTLSFEVFPPKRYDEEIGKLYETIESLQKFRPDFISVTCGASGSNRRNNVEIAGFIKKLGIEPLAHVIGGPSSPEDITESLGALEAMDVQNLLTIRGDRPKEYTEDYCKYFAHATDLIRFIRERSSFSIAAACYPEGHQECDSLYEDLIHMKEKEELGADFFITQIFYDNNYYYRLVNEARRIGITKPIIPGIMPLLFPSSIKRTMEMCGLTIPLEYRNMLEYYKDRPKVFREIGLNYSVYQIMDLIAKGAPGIHLYIMNNARTAEEIAKRLPHVFEELF
ncbi:MAG: methylenetetrahydrofolate reductase [Lachnospiraceae bacterium]|nr:methylenetetrahydrofolate reductase [Lachnospiraceae bacterium]